MQQKSLKNNFIYNFLLTGLNLIYPLIVSPFVSRILGPSNLGEVDFAITLVTWFNLFSSFGTMYYGVREVARYRDNKEKLNKLFSEILSLKAIFTAITLIVYIFCILSIPRLNSQILLFVITGIIIVFNVFSLDWFYQGIEEYGYITIRNVILKVISLVFIILFVRSKDNYILFGFISAATLALGNLINFIHSRRFVKISFRNLNLSKHISPLIPFFIYTFVVNLYTQFDQILLGFVSDSKEYVAYLKKAKSVYGLGVAITASVSNVILPRAAYYINRDREKYNNLVRKAYNSLWFISIPLVIGAAGLSKEIMHILGGEKFLVASPLIIVTSFNILISAINSWYQHQIMVPRGDEKTAVSVTAIVGLLSVLLNMVLIPYFGYMGAGVVSVLSEILVFGIKYVYTRFEMNYGSFGIISKKTLMYIFSGLCMLGVIFAIQLLKLNYIITFFSAGALGCLVYAIVLILLKDDMIYEVINFIKKKFTDVKKKIKKDS